jgi:hypothetical protein
MKENDTILNNIQAYKRKYYKGLLFRGTSFSLLILLLLLTIGGLLEYSFWFNTIIRAVILFSIATFVFIIIYKTVVIPTLFLLGKVSGMSDENAAQHIGKYYTKIDDKLLNYVQLKKDKGNSSLISASVGQRALSIEGISFSQAINLKDYLKTFPFLAIVISSIVLISVWKPSLILDSTNRIVNFNQTFSPPTLFQFTLVNKNLKGYKNENFMLKVSTAGSVIPEDMYLVLSNRKIKMSALQPNVFGYEFINPQTTASFHFESTGINSATYTLDIVSRPSLKNFTTKIIYPAYTQRGSDSYNSVGNLNVPKGSEIQWYINSTNTDSVTLHFDHNNITEKSQLIDYQNFKSNYLATIATGYEMKFWNEHGSNKESVEYTLDIIADQFPKITMESYQDTTLYSFIILNGSLSDDYGLKQLILHYKTKDAANYKSIPIPTTRSKQQSYYHKWAIDSILTQETNQLSYYLEVWDNDGVNGSKSTRTTTLSFALPEQNQINEIISKSEEAAQKDIDDALEQASELEKNIKEAKENLKGKKELSWQEENKLKDIIEKKKAINDAIEKLREQNKKSNLQKDRFTEQQERIKEKAEQLQKLMDDLLDDETKKLYEELQKLLEENKDVSDIQEKLSKLDNKEKNLEKELERALELYKRLQLEQKIEEAIDALEKASEDQESLSEQTKDKSTNLEDIEKQQEEISSETGDTKKNLEELNDLNQELKNPESIPDFKEDLDKIEETNENINEELEKGKRKKAAEQQKKAAEQMKQLAEKMQQMQGGMQMEMMQENLDHLRDVVHSLIKLSFDQESLMDNFRSIDQSDPRFVELSQTQIKLKDDAKILEDSLLSLANRVFQISSFVTREVSDMNQYMDESSVAIKERQKGQAVSKQQFAMTSMNNLALLLDDVLQQMQQQMADAMGKPKPGDKKGKDQPGMSQLQQQLNDKINDLKKGNKTGRELSEELGKLAAEQEQLRKALEQFQDNPNGEQGDGGSINDIIQKMEETEIDLVNKNITSETIKRQEEILTRLLQSEDAMREQEKDEQREGEQAKNYEEFLPKAFEEYIKAKEKEVELLKTIPPKLFPHYKNEVSEYFERVNKKIQD